MPKEGDEASAQVTQRQRTAGCAPLGACVTSRRCWTQSSPRQPGATRERGRCVRYKSQDVTKTWSQRLSLVLPRAQLLQGPPSRPPRRAIALALFLLGAGFALFVAGLALRAQHNDAGFPLLILGVLMLVPGAYHSNIVYRAWRGTPGYSFAQLPEL